MIATVSVIIPVKKINDYIINEDLPALQNQTYNNFEVIILPDELDQSENNLLKQYKWLKIVPTGSVPPGKKRAIGTENADGSVIAFIDDDAYPDKDWIKNALTTMEKLDVSCVCGPALLPLKPTFWEKVFDAILKNPIGSGVYMYRFKKMKERYVDDFPFVNFIVKKELLALIGDKDSEYWPGDDTKVCQKLVYELNQKIHYNPEIFVYHHKRNTLREFIKQHMSYGYYRGYFFGQKDQNSQKLQYILPPIFLLYIIFLLITTPLYVLYGFNSIYILGIIYIPLLLYKILLLYLLVDSVITTKDLAIGTLAPVVTFITHISYGFAFLKGIFNSIKNNAK